MLGRLRVVAAPRLVGGRQSDAWYQIWPPVAWAANQPMPSAAVKTPMVSGRSPGGGNVALPGPGILLFHTRPLTEWPLQHLLP